MKKNWIQGGPARCHLPNLEGHSHADLRKKQCGASVIRLRAQSAAPRSGSLAYRIIVRIFFSRPQIRHLRVFPQALRSGSWPILTHVWALLNAKTIQKIRIFEHQVQKTT